MSGSIIILYNPLESLCQCTQISFRDSQNDIYIFYSSGLINIPAVALGIFSGGIVMKKFRISLYGAAKLYLGSSVLGYLLFLSLFALGCENSDVAGLTISYQGYVHSLSYLRTLACLIKLLIEFQNKII